MIRWWRGLDNLIWFHPDRWPYGEHISRATALLIIGAWVVRRISLFDTFPQTWPQACLYLGAIRDGYGAPLYTSGQIALLWGVKLAVWTLETALFVGYAAAYASRAKATAKAQGFMETVYPVAVAALPVAISLTPHTLSRWAPVSSPVHLYIYITVMGLIIMGAALNLIGLITLRRAFTIMAEARELVTTGIFRSVRHPLYSGHFIMFFGSLLLRLQGVAIVLYLLFLAGQIHRAFIEERKLLNAFPAYRAYRKNTGMFFPKWFSKTQT